MNLEYGFTCVAVNDGRETVAIIYMLLCVTRSKQAVYSQNSA